MGLGVENGIPVITVFVQGILSFLSPCVLPLLPVYIGYLSGGSGEDKLFGSRLKLFINILCFSFGIGGAFFAMGLGASAIGRFLSDNRRIFSIIGGIIIMLFGVYQIGFFGNSNILGRERRLPFKMDKMRMSPITAFIFGFTFSFAWTPCVGPVLTSVLIMAGSAETAGMGMYLIGVYTLGFTLPFIFVGIFAAGLMEFFRKNRKIVKYTVKIGGVIMIITGTLMISGKMTFQSNNLSGGYSATTNNESYQGEETDSENDDANNEKLSPAIDFELQDQNGKVHRLSDYKGKVVFMNFWATWCPPCKYELPEIQKLYEKYSKTSASPEVEVLTLVSPDFGKEKSEEEIKKFIEEEGYTFPVLMDRDGSVFGSYMISSMPTTFMINEKGEVFGYVQGALDLNMMETIIEKTIKNER